MRGIEVVRSPDREVAAADATSGIVRELAFDHDDIWAGYVRTAAEQASGWHHHGSHETYFFVESGTIRMEFGPGGRLQLDAGPGDFVHVPGGLIHREVTTSGDPGALVLLRIGSGPPVINVDGPEVG